MNGAFPIPGGPVLLAAAGIVGLVVGSFLNVVIHRLPRMIERRWRADCAELAGEPPAADERYNLVVPRSACPACARPIPAWENIPLLSWIALAGRCRGCRVPIGLRYPAVELLGGGFAVLLALRFGATPAFAGGLLLVWTLIAAAAIDLQHLILPDALTLPLLWAGLLFNLRGTFAPLGSAVIGAVAGYLVLWIVYHAFRLATGKEGIGRGDFKLLAALGAWFGWQMLPLILLAGAFAGALLGGAWLLAGRRGREHPIPFGPFLAAAGVLALFAGPAIVGAWLAWARPG
ncbi:MAG TPA: A24 family peptidase [Gammaproteobacteria bacterium]|nr:A24 family peptidase [Gammaproteobacteria bacterium]